MCHFSPALVWIQCVIGSGDPGGGDLGRELDSTTTTTTTTDLSYADINNSSDFIVKQLCFGTGPSRL